MDRAGLRRKLLKAQAEAGDIVLRFADESEALTHPYLAHVWAKKGTDLRIPAPGQSAQVAMLGVLDGARRKLIVRTSRTKRSSDCIALLEEVDRRYGPKLGVVLKPIVLVLTTARSTPEGLTCGPRRARPRAQGRVATEIRAGAERHRGSLARPEATSPRPSDVQRS